MNFKGCPKSSRTRSTASNRGMAVKLRITITMSTMNVEPQRAGPRARGDPQTRPCQGFWAKTTRMPEKLGFRHHPATVCRQKQARIHLNTISNDIQATAAGARGGVTRKSPKFNLAARMPTTHNGRLPTTQASRGDARLTTSAPMQQCIERSHNNAGISAASRLISRHRA